MVLARPRIVRRFTLGRNVLDLALYLRQHAEFVEVTGSVQLCRDPRDDIFIETAQRGKADAGRSSTGSGVGCWSRISLSLGSTLAWRVPVSQSL